MCCRAVVRTFSPKCVSVAFPFRTHSVIPPLSHFPPATPLGHCSTMSDKEEASTAAQLNTASNSQSVFRSPKKINKKDVFRKRRYTVGSDVFKNFQKRRRKDDFVPPTVFLLGGNIHDPLNLNSIKTSDAQNHLTPETSPLAISPYKEKVEVLIPPNIRDPLNLSCPDGLNESDMISPVIFKNNKRNKRRRTSSETELIEKKSDFKSINEKFKDDSCLKYLGKNVSLSFTQSSNLKHFSRNNSTKNTKDCKDGNKKSNDLPLETEEISKGNNERFVYGNYNRYYGYRNVKDCDPRIKLFQKELFQAKDVLDIGCNVGHITLEIARDFEPKTITGIDIDESLIKVASKNMRHYITEKVMQSESFPSSMPILYGPFQNMPSQCQQVGSFPHNVLFFAVNYIYDKDDYIENEQAEYDTILCLSLTKWIHLNWGDLGVKQMFKRIFAQLRSGGCLLLEPQSWSSYHKKSKMTPTILENYRSIRFKPEHFNEFLLKDVGFKSCELLGTPEHKSIGFQRPIYLYRKNA